MLGFCVVSRINRTGIEQIKKINKWEYWGVIGDDNFYKTKRRGKMLNDINYNDDNNIITLKQ